MAACFPFVDPFARLENALGGVFHCRDSKALAVALTTLWEIWSLQPTLHHRVLVTRTALLKVLVVRILSAVGVRSSARRLPIDQLDTLLQLLQSVVSRSALLHRFTKQLKARDDIEQVQIRFSEFTSGWKLCIELCKLLSCSFVMVEEFGADSLNFRAPQDQIHALSGADDGTCSVVSVRTSRSVASSKYSTTPSTARFEGFEHRRAHYQSAIAKDVIPEDGATTVGNPFKLKTLEEHRYSTRFQEKKVTAKTWRSALREAHKLIESGDRVKVAAALYLLLEIIWLDPRGCNLAAMYLDSGSIYLAFDHLEEAAKAYRNSLRLDSSSWKARYNLGVATARLQDFVEATRQLKLALKDCPADVAEEINSILQEIDRIQRGKNLRAFNETKKARMFTMQYLESLHIASVTSSKSSTGAKSLLHEDCTVSHRNGVALTSSTPQLLDASHEWQGSLASFLHRLHAFATCRHLSLREEVRRLYPSQVGGVSVQAFDGMAKRITGEHLRTSERKELASMLGNDGTFGFHFLTPSQETSAILDVMQQEGVCHAFLERNLYRKRARRSSRSRAGGLWFWFELTMAKWIEKVLPNLTEAHLHNRAASLLIETLAGRGCLTPMAFAWEWQILPEPDDLPMLQLADRGIFIFECHRVRTLIRAEACCTLQMFARRYLIKVKQRRSSTRLGKQHFHRQYGMREVFMVEDVYTRLAKDTAFDQKVAREVLQCVEDMVDEVIVSDRRNQKTHEDEVRWQEIPVRTEQRQKIISAIGAVQTTLRSNESTRVLT